MKEMEEEALPEDWINTILSKIKKLKLLDREDFKQYASCARNLQSLIKNQTTKVSDLDLAEYMVEGLPKELSSKFKKN